MNRFTRHHLLPACALAVLSFLSACGGGGGEDAPPAPAEQTINFTSPGTQTFAVAPAPLVATATSNLTVSFASTTPGVCTVSGTALTLLATGTCAVSASQAGNASFNPAATVSNSFTVAPGTQTISFISPGNQTLGSAPAALMATATSGLAVSFASTTPSVCTVSGTALTLLAAGSCSINASQDGNGNFAPAAVVSHVFTVASAPLIAQTITFASPGNQILGTASVALSATSSSGLAVAFTSNTPGVCTVSGATLTLVSVGICTIVASQAGDATRAAAANVSNTFDVAPTAQTITFASPANQTFGVAPAALVATASSGLAVSFTSTTLGVCTVSGTALTLVGAGTCTVHASQAGNASFAAAPSVSRSFNVGPGTQTITFTSPGNQTLGSATPALVATASSGLAVSFASLTTNVCTVSGNTLSLLAAGSCTVVASQGGNANYSPAAAVSNTFNVATAPLTAQTVSFTSPGNQTFGTPPPALSATATSGLTVSFASTTPGVCTVSGTTLTLVAVGTCTINANQSGNGTFSAAPVVSVSFTVAAAPLAAQTITFAMPATQTVGTPLALVATASSGLPVSFASTTQGICTVSGTTLTLVAAGTCTVDASQAGNGTTVAAAPVVSRSFTVVAPLGAELMANGGFETAAVLPGQFAQGWRGVNVRPATLSNDARTGLRSASLAIPDPGFSGSGLVQNAVDDGGLASILGLHVGKTTVLTFWAKGSASVTGNVNFSLRYLDAVGNILNPVINTSFGNLINANTWTLIRLNGPAIPANTSAIFLEMTLAVGPTGVQPPGNCGVDPITGVPLPCDNGQARVLIDDVSVRVVP